MFVHVVDNKHRKVKWYKYEHFKMEKYMTGNKSSPQDPELAAEISSVFLHFTKTIGSPFPEYTGVKSVIWRHVCVINGGGQWSPDSGPLHRLTGT